MPHLNRCGIFYFEPSIANFCKISGTALGYGTALAVLYVKKPKMKNFKLLFGLCICILAFTACRKKDNSNGIKTTPYSIRMTDAPGPYSAVNINLQGIEIKGSGGTSLVMMNVNTGTYNLLNFSNGADTLIATGDLNMSKVSQIRLILGPGNTVVKNGVTYA
jgi:hypothetical protein